MTGEQPFHELSSADVIDTLPVIVAVDDDDGHTMGLFSGADGAAALRQIPVDALKENLRRTIGSLRAVFDELAAEAGDLPLKEAQIGLEVSAEGGVQLVGTAKVGAKAAITLVFGR
ncbi:Pepco domain-containing protein [Actinoallomurus sp. CA-142502]|uniref:Pepco domain-containing protein n=1 Tax=Actinoallomurus sp. CA-142502 TaxID=3239885 RepID=UPI003D8C77E2